MKTQKQILPWRLKPGMFVIIETMLRSIAPDGMPRAFEVLEVNKACSTWTGASVWRAKLKDESSPIGFRLALFHGKGRSLPAEKITIKL